MGADMNKQIPNGVYPTMLTPFTEDDHIDYDGVLRLLEWYADRGVRGVFAICQSSEIFFLSFKEKSEMLRFIMRNKPVNMKVVASGHTADDLDTQIKEANAYIDIGMDAYVFISNRFAKEGESDAIFLKNLEKAVKEINGIGLGFYECPYPYKRIITPDIIQEISSWGRFCFLKDTCCSIEMMSAKLDAMKGTGLKLFNANAATLLETLKLGCAGYSGVMANFHPELYIWLCENFNSEPEKAKLIQDFVGFFSVAECQEYPVNAKYYLGLEGLGFGYHSRARNTDWFTISRKMEIEQMHRLTAVFKEYIFKPEDNHSNSNNEI
jgi:4-hydroxy-tetrahydrodipicolinate synthase